MRGESSLLPYSGEHFETAGFRVVAALNRGRSVHWWVGEAPTYRISVRNKPATARNYAERGRITQ